MNGRTRFTEADFDSLSLHDNALHGLGFGQGSQLWDCSILLDIDFITEWILHDGKYSFRIAPATLAFDGVGDYRIQMEDRSVRPVYPEIKEIRRDAEKNSYTIVFHGVGESHGGGEIQIVATAVTMYLRIAPISTDEQCLTDEERGGVSFARTSYA
ncbi:MAG: hypothetical protein WC869_13630 [Phycisphaerae bacterium]|jgi:hypothetical protein